MTDGVVADLVTAPQWVRVLQLHRPIVGPIVIALFALTLFHGVVAWANPGYWTHATAWDERYYVEIAQKGYELPGGDYGRYTRLPFSPGWPLLLRAVAWTTGLSPIVLRSPLSALLFVLGCVAFGHALRAFSADHVRNNLAILGFACWPGSLYFCSGYAECLYLPLLMLTFGCLLRRQWYWAACGAAACWFTRTPAVVVVGALAAAIVLDACRADARIGLWRCLGRLAAVLAIAGLGLFGYIAMVRAATGDWMAFQRAYLAWEPCEILTQRGLTLRTIADALLLFPDRPTARLSVSWFLLLPVIVCVQRRAMPPVLTVFAAGAWLFFLMQDWLLIPFHDMLRWLAVVFPAPYAIACVLQRLGPRLGLWLGGAWLGASLIAYVWCATLFVTKGWVS